MADQTLDAKGLNCPLPILKAKKALNTVDANGTLSYTPAADAFGSSTFDVQVRDNGGTGIERLIDLWGRHLNADKAQKRAHVSRDTAAWLGRSAGDDPAPTGAHPDAPGPEAAPRGACGGC